ncbi:MAG: PilT/PilU family type 4a pilus ATPase [Candidatus Paceibacterota bacterium]
MSHAEAQKLIDELIETVEHEHASDLHISVGRKPLIRVAGYLVPLVNKEVITKAVMEGMMSVLMTEENLERFAEDKEIDFSYAHKRDVRFRGNGFVRQGAISIALRHIPKDISTLADLALPPILEEFAMKQQGFFLVVGPVGQGKTTTLASMIEIINQNRAEHIVTIEDPVEYVYEQKKSVIDQREVRVDTDSFATALRSVFRQDVDVLLIGEMRGLETISAAVTAAETGHLVFSTLHTNNASQTIDRIIDSFPSAQQSQIRLQLASSLSGIFSQRLIPRVSGGLVPAYELLINTNAVSNLIREQRSHEINTVIETGSEHGMIDMNRSLVELVEAGEITIESAQAYSFNPDTLTRMLK